MLSPKVTNPRTYRLELLLERAQVPDGQRADGHLSFFRGHVLKKGVVFLKS